MNTQRLSMLSLMLAAAAGWTPSVLDAAANSAAPQSLAAVPLVIVVVYLISIVALVKRRRLKG